MGYLYKPFYYVNNKIPVISFSLNLIKQIFLLINLKIMKLYVFSMTKQLNSLRVNCLEIQKFQNVNKLGLVSYKIYR